MPKNKQNKNIDNEKQSQKITTLFTKKYCSYRVQKYEQY